MEHPVFSLKGLLAAVTIGFALCACGGPNAQGIPQSPAQNSVARTHVKIKPPAAAAFLAVSTCEPCAGNSTTSSYESIYAVDGPTLRRTISNGIATPWVGLVFDAANDLFVANCTTCITGRAGVNNVVKIPKNTTTPSVTITNGITDPYDLVIDSAQTLYVSNLGCYSAAICTVAEYANGYHGGPPTNVINVKYPLGMAIDSHGNLYVGNCVSCSTGAQGTDDVLVYAPGATTPMRTISMGVNEPVSLAIDANDDLYVANCPNCGLGATVYSGGTDTVTEYSSGSTTASKTINFTSAVDIPFSIAVDPAEDLFVANYEVNSVTEYPPNATSPSKTITNGVSRPASIAIDARSILHVSNSGNNTVTEYSPNYKHGLPSHTLSVQNPASIAVSN